MFNLIIGSAVIPVVMLLISLILKDKMVKAWGVTVGKMLSVVLRTRIGKKLENIMEKKMIAFLTGFMVGLRKDNVVQADFEEKLEKGISDIRDKNPLV